MTGADDDVVPEDVVPEDGVGEPAGLLDDLAALADRDAEALRDLDALFGSVREVESRRLVDPDAVWARIEPRLSDRDDPDERDDRGGQ